MKFIVEADTDSQTFKIFNQPAKSVALPIAAGHPEASCDDCDGPNVSWHVASDLWNAVARTGDSDPMLCPRCFAVRAFHKGIDPHWVLVPQSD